MKIRTGFVSNSSSSSFVCDITGESVDNSEGMTEGMAQCVDGHNFLTHGYDEVETWITRDEVEGEDEDERYEDRYSVPTDICPVCNGKARSPIIKRILKNMADCNVTIEQLINEEDAQCKSSS